MVYVCVCVCVCVWLGLYYVIVIVYVRACVFGFVLCDCAVSNMWCVCVCVCGWLGLYYVIVVCGVWCACVCGGPVVEGAHELGLALIVDQVRGHIGLAETDSG